MLALALATTIAAGGAPPYLASCAPAMPGGIISISQPVVPDTIKPTNRLARVFIDIGSDGKPRAAHIAESSGDPVFDAAAVDAAERSRFAPPTQGCISTSSFVAQNFNVPLINLVQPTGSASGQAVIPKLPTAEQAAVCGAPGVQLRGLDVPDTKQAPGTVDVDVALDASARATGAKLAKSSGNAKTDATAVALAKDAQFAFITAPGCAAKPEIYRLELTFH